MMLTSVILPSRLNRMLGHLCTLLWLSLTLTPVVYGQGKEKSRLPKVDWPHDEHGVWLATAVRKDNEVEIRVIVPMWSAKPELKGKDPEGPDDFVASEMKASLKSSDVKVYRKNGTLVETKELPRLLAKETPVLWWGTGKIDPYYLAVMRDDVLVFVVDVKKVIKASEGAAPSTPQNSGSQ